MEFSGYVLGTVLRHAPPRRSTFSDFDATLTMWCKRFEVGCALDYECGGCP
jgi:hypothetical protein